MEEQRSGGSLWTLVAIFLLLILFFITNPLNLEWSALKVVSVAIMMVTLWVTEILPMPVVSLIPLVVFPLTGIMNMEDTAKAYANPVIFLFLGGFLLSLAIEKWHMHQRMALWIISKTGTSGNHIILGFMLATGLLSMWLSNTATTMMMYPIALSVLHMVMKNRQENANYKNFGVAIMLAIAYAANLGGIATPIGTPPNVAFLSFYQEKYNQDIDFAQWMMIGFPVAIVLILFIYFVMVKWLFPNAIGANTASAIYFKEEKDKLGPISISEKRVLTVFLITSGLWIFRTLINDMQSFVKLDDTIIAIFGAILLFIIPSGKAVYAAVAKPSKFLLDWSDTSKMSWGTLLLFGGGISLANGLEKSGILQVLSAWLTSSPFHPFVLLVMVTVISVFLSEVMSNVAQVIVFAPLVMTIADQVGMHPLMLGIPMTMAASCSGMLPMGTPPNAIVFAGNHLRLIDMVKAGLILNIMAVILISLICWYLIPVIW